MTKWKLARNSILANADSESLANGELAIAKLCAVAVALGIEPRRMLSVAEKENIRSNDLSIARNDVIMTRR